MFALAIAIIVFFILRELSLWFYRINSIIKNQEATNIYLKLLINLQSTGDIKANGKVLVKDTESGDYLYMEKEDWKEQQKKNSEQNKHIRV